MASCDALASSAENETMRINEFRGTKAISAATAIGPDNKQSDPLAQRPANQPAQRTGYQRQESAAGCGLQNQENAVADPAPRRQLEHFGLSDKRSPDHKRQHQE
jgi:hypothetical protein